MAPDSAGGWSGQLAPDASLVPFAAVVQRAVVGRHELQLAADEAPIHAFIEKGAAVRLADDGSQWVHAFNRPTLIVEVVDPDPERAAAGMRERLEEIETTAQRIQAQRGIAPAQLITVTIDDTDRGHAVSSRSRLLRAWVVSLGMGFTLSLVAANVVGRWRWPLLRARGRLRGA